MENILLENLFKKITIGNSIRMIQSVFISSRKLEYNPPYQREYVWTEVKATNFIETILWHGEIPPVVLYQKSDDRQEVIDGRQRCQTIDLFLNDAFDLQAHGLDKLWYLAGKTFSQLDEKLKYRILQAKLRCILIQAKGEGGLTEYEEERIKREIFKRYNMGMSALKKEEVYKAQYLHDDITLHFKRHFEQDRQLYNQVKNVFNYKSRNAETLMHHIRELLVLADIPINRYVTERDDTISKYYEYYAYHLVNRGAENLEHLLFDFKRKIQFLAEVKDMLSESHPSLKDVLVAYDCVYWAMSICEKQEISFDDINSNKDLKGRLAKHIAKNAQIYSCDSSNYGQYIKKRYETMATFFSRQFVLSPAGYLKADREYSATFRNQISQYMDERFGDKVKGEHATSTTPTSATVADIIHLMKETFFHIRPPYQRREVMNTAKASLLVESILLGIKLPPIYVFVREDNTREVIDGQQRLLAILAFLGEKYLDEQRNPVTTQKNNFALNIANPVLPEINKRKFSQLPELLKNCIWNYDLDLIEIRQTDNQNFKPEELYKRLNHKPFPIKEHTFEYWNAYIDSDFTGAIKDIYRRNRWLYVIKEDKRMRSQEMITCLCYLQYLIGNGPISIERVRQVLSFFEYTDHIVIRIKNRTHITEVLESTELKGELFISLNNFEHNFIAKLSCLTANPKRKTTEQFRNKMLDSILQTKGVRKPMRFIVLWLILRDIPIERLEESRVAVLSEISKVFATIKVAGAGEKLEKALADIWKREGVSVTGKVTPALSFFQ